MSSAAISNSSRWRAGLEHELAWWRSFLQESLANDPDYLSRFDPDAPLQPHVARLLPADRPVEEIRILDCAAGPASALGKTLGGARFDLVAVDVLAERYKRILAELNLQPPVPSWAAEIEQLDQWFAQETFDLVYMRFALDHCRDPLQALTQMLRVVRAQGAVLIEHYRDEHDTVYAGLKQWTLEPLPADLIVFNDRHRFAAATALPGVSVSSDYTNGWMRVVIRKTQPASD